MQFTKLLSIAVMLGCSAALPAATIHVINAGVSGHVGVATAVSHLTSLGHSVSAGGTLSDYSAFDQVWDLRYNVNFALADLTAYESYLAGGGRLYLTGENPSFDASRNTSLRGLLFALGAGDVPYSSATALNEQTFTVAGAALNSPNPFVSVDYLGARLVTGGGNGFLVTESPAGAGSMVAWDFGQIAGAPDARLIALWDIDVFRAGDNGVEWTDNMASFLGAERVAEVPEPATFVGLASGLFAIAGLRRRRQGGG